MTNNGARRLRFGVYEVDLKTGELWKEGVGLKVAGQPFEILAYLIRRPGQLVSREELRTQLWPEETFVDFDHGLNTAINKLRAALCDSAEDPRYIETLPRRGYRFIAAVEEGGAEPEQPEVCREKPGGSVNGNSGSSGTVKRTLGGDGAAAVALEALPPPAGTTTSSAGLSTLRRYWLVAAALTIAVIGVWVFGRRAQVSSVSKENTADLTGPQIVVNSLTNLSDHTSQAAFSPDGSRVAFVREGFLSANGGIWWKQVAGEELVQVTNNKDDCCPVWSGDGQWVAFSRVSGGRRKIYKVAANGGELHELLTTDPVARHEEFDWSPDGKAIAFVDLAGPETPAIFLYSLEERKIRQITTPAMPELDWGPRFSPDGSRISFVRKDDIMVISVGAKEIQRLTRGGGRVMGSPAWTPDGQWVVFASMHKEGPTLMRVSATGGVATPIGEAGKLAWNPAISRRGFRLACDHLSVSRSIDQLDLVPAGQETRTLVTTEKGENAGAQVSHDGTKLVFQSDRGGESDIWVSDRDGENPVRMTALGTASAPRWSPDDKEIAFEARSGAGDGKNDGIFVVKAGGGEARSVVQDGFNNRAPRWSNDGKWIYFGSNRSGAWQVWKAPAWGGTAVQVTRHGGFAAEESEDGKDLFYVREGSPASIWKMPVGGGDESEVDGAIHPVDWAAWTLVKDGMLFVEPSVDDDVGVSLFDLSSKQVRHLADLDKAPFWLTATRDGRAVIFDQPGQFEGRVVVLENFR
jgi:Tol biopolymer transport system component/DNA-binding winged helix-turn-helix (wHTH) protein